MASPSCSLIAGTWVVIGLLASINAQTAGPQRPSERLPTASAATVTAPPATAALPPAVPKQYCFTWHNDRARIGGLALDTLSFEHVAADAATWEKVVRKIRTGMMPPSGARRPERDVLDGFASELETRLDQAVPPGAGLEAPALHRLNRTEYSNAIR